METSRRRFNADLAHSEFPEAATVAPDGNAASVALDGSVHQQRRLQSAAPYSRLSRSELAGAPKPPLTWLKARGPPCCGRVRASSPEPHEASSPPGPRSGLCMGAPRLQVGRRGPWGGALTEGWRNFQPAGHSTIAVTHPVWSRALRRLDAPIVMEPSLSSKPCDIPPTAAQQLRRARVFLMARTTSWRTPA